jgi:hypothetical protein
MGAMRLSTSYTKMWTVRFPIYVSCAPKWQQHRQIKKVRVKVLRSLRPENSSTLFLPPCLTSLLSYFVFLPFLFSMSLRSCWCGLPRLLRFSTNASSSTIWAPFVSWGTVSFVPHRLIRLGRSLVPHSSRYRLQIQRLVTEKFLLCFILAHSLTISVLHIFAQMLGFRVFPDFRLPIYSLVPELHSRMCCSLAGRLCSSNPPEAGVIRRPTAVSEIANCLLPELYCIRRGLESKSTTLKFFGTKYWQYNPTSKCEPRSILNALHKKGIRI